MTMNQKTTLCAIAAAVATLVGCGGGGTADQMRTAQGMPPAQANDNLTTLRVLSNRADLVSGGDALVEIVRPDKAKGGFKIDLDGVDVTGAFAVRADGRLTGLVTGLKDGENVLRVQVPNGPGARLVITNHPRGGSVFSGTQLQPWTCNTTANPSLGEATDAQCNAPTMVRYMYRSLDNRFQAYDPANPPPAGSVASTTTDAGVTVPYIVRIERGTMNRGIHEIAVLADPGRNWTAFDPQPQWNHKVVMHFGGGTSQQYRQGTPESVMNNEALAAGFMVATSSMMVNGQHANFVTAAETTMMLKEHIIENYGRIRYTIGSGSSGGALLQHLLADNYPGLLDGLRPTNDWTDSMSGAYREFADNAVLTRAFDNSALTYSLEDRSAFSGFGPENVGVSNREAQRIGDYVRPDDGTNCAGADSYDEVTNPNGVRCTFQDFMSSVIGQRPDGKTRAVYDNVGVQFGLVALLKGEVSVEKFVDVNVNAGAFDIDGRWQPQRSAISPEVAAIHHRTGQVTYGRYMGQVPEIVARTTNNNDYHYPFRTYVQRARLLASGGTAEGHVIWTRAPNTVSTLKTMDQWLSAIEGDDTAGSSLEKLARNRPAGLVDTCWISGQPVTDQSACDVVYPILGEPRTAAGDSTTGYVMKCQLKPMVREDYPGVSFTDAQWMALQGAFPSGVCDFSKPAVGFQPNVPWLTYANGPGGVPLGTAPASLPGDAGR